MLWEPERHVPFVVAPWNADAARDAIRRIVVDAEAAFDGVRWPVHPDDEPERYGLPSRASIYWGAAGVVLALRELQRAGFGTRDWSGLDLVSDARDGSYLMGEVGALSVDGPGDRLLASIEANLSLRSNELMLGAPGVTLAAFRAYVASRDERFADAARRGARALLAELEDDGLWTQRLSGSTPRYLGLVHGFAGNAGVLARVEGALGGSLVDAAERHAARDGRHVNWPAQPDEQPALMQVCHGAPGFVIALGSIPALRSTMEAAGEAIYAAGPLAKGTTFCHGDAGSGLAMLSLFVATGDERWLERARSFAVTAIARCDAARARHGRGRYSLWTGDLGVACFLEACIHGTSRFPSLD